MPFSIVPKQSILLGFTAISAKISIFNNRVDTLKDRPRATILLPTLELRRYRSETIQAFQTLGINPTRDRKKIKDAYLNLCLQLHPDLKTDSDLEPKVEDVKLVEVIKAFHHLRQLKDNQLISNLTNSTYKRDADFNTDSYRYYQQPHVEIFTRPGENPPQYTTNAKVVIFILSIAFLGLILQYIRVVSIHGTLLEQQQRQFDKSAKSYYKALQLSQSLGTVKRMELFIEQYNKGRNN